MEGSAEDGSSLIIIGLNYRPTRVRIIEDIGLLLEVKRMG